jgi:hypothetical protein
LGNNLTRSHGETAFENQTVGAHAVAIRGKCICPRSEKHFP